MSRDISYHEKKIYEKYFKKYEKRTEDYTKFIEYDIDLFLDNLPGDRILDLGSGPGRDSKEFKERGFKPICLDISENMISRCKEKGLEGVVGNFENRNFEKNTFDGIWSYTSLTTNTKENFEKVISNCTEMLKEDGALFLGLIEGEGEGWREADEKYDLKRYRSRYTFPEVYEKLNSMNLELVYFRKIPSGETGRNTYLNFLYKNK